MAAHPHLLIAYDGSTSAAAALRAAAGLFPGARVHRDGAVRLDPERRDGGRDAAELYVEVLVSGTRGRGAFARAPRVDVLEPAPPAGA